MAPALAEKQLKSRADIREDLNGLRIRLPGTSPIYLVDMGKKRHIPNPVVYNELFSTWDGVIEDLDVDEVETADPIPETAILFRLVESPKVYLLDGKPGHYTKRHIVNPAVMDHYRFNWNRIHVWNVPLDVLNIPDGPPITNPPNAV